MKKEVFLTDYANLPTYYRGNSAERNQKMTTQDVLTFIKSFQDEETSFYAENVPGRDFSFAHLLYSHFCKTTDAVIVYSTTLDKYGCKINDVIYNINGIVPIEDSVFNVTYYPLLTEEEDAAGATDN